MSLARVTPTLPTSPSFKRIVRKSKRRIVKHAFLAGNVLLVVAVAGFVVRGQRTMGAATQQQQSLQQNSIIASPLDKVSSVDIALNVARTAGLPETVPVISQAISFETQLALASTDEQVVAKPQIVLTSLKSRKDIQNYKTKAGDTVSSLATTFGVTSDSIRWSNNIVGDALTADKELLIPPRNGIVYEVKSGDTVEGLADKYKSNKEQIIAFNDIELTGLPVGERIVIPDGQIVIVPTVTRVAPSLVSSAVAYGFVPTFNSAGGFNGYDYGYCTWYVANKRTAIGSPVPTNLGNASTWKARAAAAGMAIGSAPQAGAVAWKYPRDYYGHVAYVESVNDDGSFLISEMNTAGWNRISSMVVPAGGASGYVFIY